MMTDDNEDDDIYHHHRHQLWHPIIFTVTAVDNDGGVDGLYVPVAKLMLLAFGSLATYCRSNKRESE